MAIIVLCVVKMMLNYTMPIIISILIWKFLLKLEYKMNG